jgi:endonuclease/exonuclease/phosphatase family metal-dependent hydrolase
MNMELPGTDRPATIIFSFMLMLFILTGGTLHAGELVLAWWNVQNCFDTVDDPRHDDTVAGERDYSDKISALSDVIRTLDADIVGLAEIENITVLEDLADDSGYPWFYLEEGNDPRGIDVALMSRYRAEYRSHRDQPVPYPGNPRYKFSRDCPEAVITINGHRLVLMLNHLKSKLGNAEKNRAKQLAQCRGILDIIADRYAVEPVPPAYIIMGDFNSNRYSEPLNLLEKSGLIILNYRERIEKVYTTVYRGQKQELDYFILNRQMHSKTSKQSLYAVHSRHITEISDHFPLVLRITLK